MLALVDVFEALTASDRPYKEPKKLSDSIKILSFMVKDRHIDKDVFELFLRSGVYKKYAEEFINPDQVDDVDIEKYL
jgi:HD-GYP domain-containing protein (c-di-GMP phosphodiesterase class II)